MNEFCQWLSKTQIDTAQLWTHRTRLGSVDEHSNGCTLPMGYNCRARSSEHLRVFRSLLKLYKHGKWRKRSIQWIGKAVDVRSHPSKHIATHLFNGILHEDRYWMISSARVCASNSSNLTRPMKCSPNSITCRHAWAVSLLGTSLSEITRTTMLNCSCPLMSRVSSAIKAKTRPCS